MATAYSSKLRLALPVQGELTGTWGDTVNDEITSMIEEALAGYVTIDSWTTNSHTLTTVNGATDEARNAILNLTDTGVALSGAGTLICPASSKMYIVKNGTGQQITIKTSGGTGVAIPNGTTTWVFCDGTNVESAMSYAVSMRAGTLTDGTATLTGGALSGATTGAFSGALTAATLDTGQGANELYAMDQAVRTSDTVTFAGQTITGNAQVNGNFGVGGAAILDFDAIGANSAFRMDLSATDAELRATNTANSAYVQATFDALNYSFRIATVEAFSVDGSRNTTFAGNVTINGVATVSTSAGQVGSLNSTHVNGGYLTFQDSGSGVGDIGSGAQIVGTSTSEWGINSRPAVDLILGSGNTKRVTIDASTGDTTFTGAVGINGYTAGAFGAEFAVKVATNENVALFDNGSLPTITCFNDAGSSAPFNIAGFPLTLSGNGGAGAAGITLDGSNNATFAGDVAVTRTTGNTASLDLNSGSTGAAFDYVDVGSGRTAIYSKNNTGGTANIITIGFGAPTAGVPSLSNMQFTQDGNTKCIGNFGVNITPSTGGKIRVDGGTTETCIVSLQNSASALTHLQVDNSNGTVGTIVSSGTTTAYNTTSDPRLKDFKALPTDAEVNAKFDSLYSVFRIFDWKNGSDTDVWGFDAHAAIDAGLDIGSEGQGPRNLEIGDVYDTDEDGNELKVTPAGVDQSKAVPILLAKIKQQDDIIQSLVARIEALEGV